MTSPAHKRFHSVLAAARGTESPLAVRSENTYELMLMQLTEHRRILKTVQALARKLQAKSQFLPEYDAYIDGTIKGDSGVQDEVFVTVLLWHIDVGNIDRAIELAAYALKHDLVMPDRFERNLACTIAEEIAETAARVIETETPVKSEQLKAVLDLTAECDMYDEARAKLLRQMGQAFEAEGELTAALDAYQQALALNDKVGVKKFIEKLTRELKNADKQTTESTAPATAGSAG
ncbi:MAG: phage terminase small subunit [Shewanella xiamenensis]